ncbi:MAG: hypothetical protein KC713_05865 [Candidatus Omnitrophica bacterium]|nr:hypothetical protein [Candidatus Omnitrophota bacterium]
MNKKWIITLGMLIFMPVAARAHDTGKVSVDYKGKIKEVTYELFLPEGVSRKSRLPIVVCSGGVPTEEGAYVRSSTKECFGSPWREFAKKNKFAILGLGFLFDEEDWPSKESYQFPHAWSGQAVDQILKLLSRHFPVDTDHLYLYGVSGGSQFSVRYALLRPLKVKAVAAHAAGSYDPPWGYIPGHFLITVGELDNDPILRKDMAVEFAQAMDVYGIDHQLEIVEGIAHQQTESQDEMSRDYFVRILNAPRRVKDDVAAEPQANYSLPMGLPEEELFRILPREQARTLRKHGEESFMTYFYGPAQDQFLTVHIKNGVLYNWALNARSEIVDEFASEFIPGGLIRGYPKTFEAIRNVLNKLPEEPFKKVIDRGRPVIFLDVASGGIARYANAIDFYFRPGDPAAFEKGFYLIKLGEELEEADDVQQIEGIIAHELTHHVLDHLRGPVDCDTEREANRLVKKWGFEEELKKASERFGAKKPEDSPCYEPKPSTAQTDEEQEK